MSQINWKLIRNQIATGEQSVSDLGFPVLNRQMQERIIDAETAVRDEARRLQQSQALQLYQNDSRTMGQEYRDKSYVNPYLDEVVKKNKMASTPTVKGRFNIAKNLVESQGKPKPKTIMYNEYDRASGLNSSLRDSESKYNDKLLIAKAENAGMKKLSAKEKKAIINKSYDEKRALEKEYDDTIDTRKRYKEVYTSNIVNGEAVDERDLFYKNITGLDIEKHPNLMKARMYLNQFGQAGAATMVGDEKIRNEKVKGKNKIANFLVDMAGMGAGIGANPAGMGGMGAIGSGGEKVVSKIGAKIAPKIASKMPGLATKLSKGAVTGALDMGAYTLMQDEGAVSNGQKITPGQELADIGINSAVGAGLGVGFSALGTAGKGVLRKVFSKTKTGETNISTLLPEEKIETPKVPGETTPNTGNNKVSFKSVMSNLGANEESIASKKLTANNGIIEPSANNNIPSSKVKIGSQEIEVANEKIPKIQALADELKLAIKDKKLSKVEPIKTKLAKELNVSKDTPSKNFMDLQFFADSNIENVTQGSSGVDLSQYIVSGNQKKTLGSKIKSGWDTFYRKIVDNNLDIGKFVKQSETASGKKLLGADNPYKMASIAGTHEGMAYQDIYKGVANREGKVIGKSLKEVADAIPRGKEKAFDEYVIAKHALSWMDPAKKGLDMENEELVTAIKQVFPKDVTLEQVQTRVTELENLHPEFKGLQKDAVKYNSDILKTKLLDSGFISKDTYLKLTTDYPNYMPLNREMSDAEVKGVGRTNGKYVDTGSPIKGAEGSQRRIMRPIESMIKNTVNYSKTAKNNEIGQAIVKRILANPDELKGFAEIVEKYKDNSIEKALKEGTLGNLLDDFNQSFSPKKVGDLGKGNIVTVRMNGDAYNLQINDAHFFDALTKAPNPNAFLDVARKTTGYMTKLTTGQNPVFSIARNVWRDLTTGYINSPTSNKIPVPLINYGKYLTEIIQSNIEILAKSAGYKDYKAIGGGFMSSWLSSEKNMYAKATDDLLSKGITFKKIRKLPFKILDGIEYISNAIETGPRYREYKNTVKTLTKKGVDKYTAQQEGLYQAADVTTNFRRHGDFTKNANAIVPFLNAAVQGLDKTIRQFNPKSVGTKQVIFSTVKAIESITLPAMFLYAINKDNPAYKQQSRFTKDNYFLIPTVGSTFIKIPKPREFGALFGAIPERLMDKMQTNNPEAFKGLLETLDYAFSPPNIITENIFAPAIKTIASDQGSDWRNRPIVPNRLTDLPKEMQYTDATSKPSVLLSQGLAKLGIKFSPMKMDNLIKSYTGVFGQMGIPATSGRTLNEDGLLKGTIETLKRYVTADSRYSNDLSDDFYANMQKVNEDKSIAKLNGELTGGETNVERASYIFNQAIVKLADLRDAQREAKTNKEKDTIQDQMNVIYKMVNEDYKKNYETMMNSYTRKRDFNRRND